MRNGTSSKTEQRTGLTLPLETNKTQDEIQETRASKIFEIWEQRIAISERCELI